LSEETLTLKNESYEAFLGFTEADLTPTHKIYKLGYRAGLRGRKAKDFLELSEKEQFLSIPFPDGIVGSSVSPYAAMVTFFAGLSDGRTARLDELVRKLYEASSLSQVSQNGR